MRKILVLLIASYFSLSASAQSEDEKMIKSIFDKTLTEGQAYDNLDYLTNKIGARLSGSPQAAAAVEWSKQVMESCGFDKVYLQEVMVPHWVRGAREKARIVNSDKLGTREVNVRALGNSVGTGSKGVLAEVVEVMGLEELEKLGKKNIEGKIVFFNRPMDQTQIATFSAYGGAVDQRGSGPSEAAKYGAIGVVVRSVATVSDDFPHTGSLRYKDDLPKIPAVAISTNDADILTEALKSSPGLKFYFETHCEMLPDVLSYNVIAEMTGTEKPEEIIVVGGHLDSWDLGTGAHDDGSGCVQSIEVLRTLKALGYKPKRTLRAVMFMNEENGLRGGTKYAEVAKEKGENHISALESDSGGFSPRGFRMTGDENSIALLSSWRPLFEPYGIYEFGLPGGGADIGPLSRSQGTLVIGLMPDSQRYFDYHHTDNDTFDKVNKRELHLGAAGMTALVYMMDKYGVK
ncbi:M20/M25/M40 family metallo-hydrolase [Fulvivirga lutimaris]|uniref:M20/M25/M40 family metallo-hydrolase n=1 Tax=Fulvivirga lutimaris TaxID=1819566 RepID=UPI0012BCAA4F|nr:M20/M25/M40 family metallo-hydrolase [Fulvivirga lutimaris]MTI39098.1 peptidase M28 family protein [Fulvivirga lutimaris]